MSRPDKISLGDEEASGWVTVGDLEAQVDVWVDLGITVAKVPPTAAGGCPSARRKGPNVSVRGDIGQRK
jgi:hypothetical protein